MNLDRPLPEYKLPPVVEVVLSVQFDPIEGMISPHLGLLWQRFKDDFPYVEEHPPLPVITEDFVLRAAPRMGLQIETSDEAITPRLWFLSETKTQLVQVQRDRFVHNWRKTETDQVYPRYDTIRPSFEKELRAFGEFLVRQNLPPIKINQCEITYINHIVSGKGWTNHSDVSSVLAPWGGSFSDDSLSSPDDLNLNARYVIRAGQDPKPLGRLHINLQSAYRAIDQKEIFVATLTARGRPLTAEIEGALQFLNLGREWIVRGFTSITTKEMHKVWERTK